jgi:transposase-like protein
MGKRRTEAWAKWRRIVAEQQRSGKSVAAFCRERGLCASYLFAWKKRLSEASAEQFVAVHVVEAGQQASARAIEVRLGGGRSVVVEPGFDAAHFRAVLDALEART